MRNTVLAFMLAALSFAATAQENPPSSGKFIIHRHLKVVGAETYSTTQLPSGATTYSIDCNYTDRGTNVPLKASIALSPANEPIWFKIKGKTSRFSAIDDSVAFTPKTNAITSSGATVEYPAAINSFPVDGYAPATAQWLMVKYWLQKGKPSTIEGLPTGKITITDTGLDTLRIDNTPILLQGYAIKNVIWGWEFLWIDMQGNLAGLITINAEGDKIEFIDEKYETLLTQLTKLSARYGVAKYASQNTASPGLAITNCVYTNIASGRESAGYTILIKNGTIVWSGPDAEAIVPPGAKVIDAKGKHALPGLWDMHAHLKQVEWGPAYIAAGITTVRDMANEFDFINTLKNSIDEGKGIGPRILRAGIIDGTSETTNGVRIADTPAQAIALVKEYKASGFDQIKLYGSLKPDIISIICDEAHRQGMSVTGHVPTSVTLTEAIDKGLDHVAHLHFITRSLEYDKTTYAIDFNSDANRKFVAFLKKKKVVVDPTIALLEIVYRPLSSPMTDIEPAFNELPKSLQAHFTSMGLPAEEAAKRRAGFELQKKMLLHLYKSGIPIVAGTDMLIPGYSLYRELELYVSAGLTPLQALQSATLVPASAMKKSATAGTLENGKQADIILVNGNPLKNISDIRKIELVIKGGEVFDPKTVRATVDIGLQN